MKKLIVYFLLVLLAKVSFGQGLTKNAKGESSILFRGNSISFDLGETELTFSASNLKSSLGLRHKFIYGAGVKTKNESGIGNLFSGGDLVPDGKVNLFAGYSFSNGIPSNFRKEFRRQINESKDFFNLSLDDTKDKLRAIILKNTSDTNLLTLRQILLGKVDTADKSVPPVLLYDCFNSVVVNNLNQQEKVAFSNIKKEKTLLFEEVRKKAESLEGKVKVLEEELYTNTYWQLMFYGFGGINASEFKSFNGFDSSNLKNSFTNQDFRGGNLGLGVNLQLGAVSFGLSYSYLKTNNFSLLNKKEYTLRNQQVIGTQTLIEEKKITAYAGAYGEVEVNEIKADLIYNYSLNSDQTHYMLVNPYYRGQTFSRKNELLPNSANVGCGFYYFKSNGNFLGGIYVELPDIDNNYEKAKPVEDQNFRKPLERITFGVVAKFSIASLLNTF